MKAAAFAGLLALASGNVAIAAGVVSSDLQGVTAGSYTLDPSHTSVAAAVGHMGFSNTTVNFDQVFGSLYYDPAKPGASTLNVSIATDSLDSGWTARDGHLKGAQFFNVAAHPTATFRSSSLQQTGPRTASVAGDLTLLGVSKPVTLAVKFNGSGKGMDGADRIGFAATATIKRSDFGMTAFLPAVGDEVAITIETEFSKK